MKKIISIFLWISIFNWANSLYSQEDKVIFNSSNEIKIEDNKSISIQKDQLILIQRSINVASMDYPPNEILLNDFLVYELDIKKTSVETEVEGVIVKYIFVPKKSLKLEENYKIKKITTLKKIEKEEVLKKDYKL